MSGRNSARLREEKLMRKRDNEARQLEQWNSQCKYYDQYSRNNRKFDSWTSPEMSAVSLKKYDEIQENRKKLQELEEENNKKDLLLFEEKQKAEIAAQEELRNKKYRFNRNNEAPIDVLREINKDLKAKEEAQRRCEAEKKLYDHWRINNPYVRQCEMNQRQSNLKIAWLDAQIEKQMAKEKEEEEMKKFLMEREKRMKEEEELERENEKRLEERKKELNEIINRQVEELKKKESITELLRQEEAAEIKKKDKYDEIMREREEMQKKHSRLELDLYNLTQHRLKLRRRAKIVAEEVAEEKRVLEKILEMELQEKAEENEKKINLRQTLTRALDCLKEQQDLEKTRQEYLGMIFDSEAKVMLQKQENIWKQEKKNRDDLFQDVLNTIKKQIDEKVQEKVEEQKKVCEEKEHMLQQIEQANKELEQEKEEEERKKNERKKVLDCMVDDKVLREKQSALLEQIEREKQLEKFKQEEERLRKEIAEIQLQTKPDAVKFPRRRVVW